MRLSKKSQPENPTEPTPKLPTLIGKPICQSCKEGIDAGLEMRCIYSEPHQDVCLAIFRTVTEDYG